MNLAYRLSMFTVLLVALLHASVCSGALHTAHWAGGASGDWNVSTNWTPQVVPDNTVTDQYDVYIGVSLVTLPTYTGDYGINELHLAGGGQVRVSYGSSLTLNDDAANDGTIRLNDISSTSSNYADLIIAADVALNGAGAVRFATNYQNRILGTGGSLLTISANQTVGTTGANTRGEIQARFDNYGVVDADGGTVTLNVTDKINHGTLAAHNGGTLNINTSVANHGQIGLDATSRINFNNGVAITGGTIMGAGKAHTAGAVTFDGSTMGAMTLTNLTTQVDYNSRLTLKGNFHNNGLIRLHDISSTTSNYSDLVISGAVLLGGNGAVHMDTNYQNRILAETGAGDVLTVGTNQSIIAHGTNTKGEIQVAVQNNGLLEADGGTLLLNSAGKTNANLIRARNGGLLDVRCDIVNNDTITVEGGSTMTFASSTITGGLIDGGGMVRPVGASTFDATAGMTLDNVHTRVDYNTSLTLKGSIVNDGIIELNDVSNTTSNYADLWIHGSVNLNGGGAVHMDTNYQNRIMAATGAGDRLHVAATQSIIAHGANTKGEVQVGVTNHGLMEADGGLLTLNSANKTNHHLIRARNGGTLQVDTNILNHDTITVESGSRMNLRNSTIADGTIDGGGLLYVQGTSMLDATAGIDLDVTTQVDYNQRLVLKGSVVNDGVIRLNDVSNTTSNYADLAISGNVMLDGGGAVHMVTNYQNRILAQNGAGDLLTVRPGQSIIANGANTRGQVKVPVGNYGLIEADGGMMILDTSNKDNRHMIRARNGGTVHVHGITVSNNGAMDIPTGTTLELKAATIRGGQISGDGDIEVIGTATLDGGASGMTIGGSTTTVIYNEVLTLQRSITHDGVFRLNDYSNTTSNYADLRVDGAVVLDGGGVIRFDSIYQNRITQTGAGSSLTLGPQYTLALPSGRHGVVMTELHNQGTASLGNSIGIGAVGADHTNSGAFKVLAGTTTVTGDSFTNQAGGVISGGGMLNVSGVAFVSHGTIAPGTSVGTLHATGHVVQAAGGVLAIDIDAGGNDLLAITGTADLAGAIDVTLGGYVPTPGDLFTVCTASGGLTNSGLTMASGDQGAWLIRTPDVHTLQIEYVPEPATLVFVALGAALFVRRRG